MISPIRIQRSRKHKQVSPNGLPTVYVGRPTKWGNPFKVKDELNYDAAECVRAYKVHVLGKLYIGVLNIEELKGKNLSCFCKIGEPCHADILLKIANK